jgi:hypothetical protein
MLDNTWKTVKKEVDLEINEEEELNVCFDKALNINHQRIYNISVITKEGAFYYYNTSLGPDTAGAAYTAENITEALTVVT